MRRRLVALLAAFFVASTLPRLRLRVAIEIHGSDVLVAALLRLALDCFSPHSGRRAQRVEVAR